MILSARFPGITPLNYEDIPLWLLRGYIKAATDPGV